MASDKDKKKLIIVGVLVFLICGIGAFQLVGSSEPGSPAPKSEAKKPAEETTTVTEEHSSSDQLQQIVARSLPQRDPFAPATLPSDSAPVTEKPSPEPAPSLTYRPRKRSSGSVPPLSPMVGQLPDPTGEAGAIGIEPGKPLRQPGEFAYQVNGVVLGSRPAVVLQDDNGNQRLVPVGGSVDKDSRVVGVERGKVTVQHKGKKLTLSMGGGTPVDK